MISVRGGWQGRPLAVTWSRFAAGQNRVLWLHWLSREAGEPERFSDGEGLVKKDSWKNVHHSEVKRKSYFGLFWLKNVVFFNVNKPY